MTGYVRIRGIEDVNRVLQEIAPREAKNLLRATVNDVAGHMAKEAKSLAPKEGGDLADAIRHKRSRGTRDKVQSDVIVGKAAFYWRYLEYGQGPDRVEHAFFLRSLQEMRGRLSTVYVDVFVKKLVARLARKARTGR